MRIAGRTTAGGSSSAATRGGRPRRAASLRSGRMAAGPCAGGGGGRVGCGRWGRSRLGCGRRDRDRFGPKGRASPGPAPAAVPVLEQHAVLRPSSPRGHPLVVGHQHPGPGAALARLHVLREDQHLVARRLDDRVQVAAEHQGRGLERLLVRDLHDLDARHLHFLSS